MQRLESMGPSHPLHHNTVVHLLDHFTTDSVNGQHKCLVMELVGITATTLSGQYLNRCMPLGVVKQITRDTLCALDYMELCGIIHTGMYDAQYLFSDADPVSDIKPSNIFMALDDPEGHFRDYLSTNTPLVYPKTSIPGNQRFHPYPKPNLCRGLGTVICLS